MRKLAERFGISTRAYPRCAAFSLLYFLFMFGLTVGRTSRDAFFLKTAGPSQLPLVYILVALSLLAVSRFYSRHADSVSKFSLFRSVLWICIGALLGVRGLMGTNLGWAPHAVFCLTETIYTFLLLHFWTTGTQCFNPREGKRAFPIIGASGLVGVIAGGVGASTIVTVLANANLVIVWSGILLLMLVVLSRARSVSESALGDAFDKPATPSKTDDQSTPLGDLSFIRDQPLVRTIAIVAIPMWITIYLTDFLFMSAVNEAAESTAQLTTFLGLFNAMASVVGLVIQLFLTGPLLARLGVGAAVLAHPICVFAGLTLLTARGMFSSGSSSPWSHPKTITAVAAKLSDVSIYNSIAESGTTLLLSALPESIRGRCRALKDGVIDPIAIAIAGGFIALLVFLDFEYGSIAGIALGICALWLAASTRLKLDYRNTLLENLRSQDFDLRLRSLKQVQSIARPEDLEAAAASIEESDPEMARFLFPKSESRDQTIRLKSEPATEEPPTFDFTELRILYRWEDAASLVVDDPGGADAHLLAACLSDACDRLELRLLDILRSGSPTEQFDVAVTNLRASTRRHRAEAIELLDTLGGTTGEIAREFDRRRAFDLTRDELDETLGDIVNDADPLPAALAASFVPTEMIGLVSTMKHGRHPLLRGRVLRALNGLGTPDDMSDDDRRTMSEAEATLNRILFLRKVPVFADINPADLPLVANLLSEQRLEAGQTIIREGEAGDILYIVADGAVRVFHQASPETTLSILETGECFGELALLDDEPRSATVETTRPSTFLLLRKSDFEQLLHARPGMAMAIIRTLSRRFRDLLGKVENRS